VSSKVEDAAKPAVHAIQGKSGFERCKREIEVGLLLMSVVYGLVFSMNPPLSPAEKFCAEGETECKRPDLIAYKITAAITMMYISFLGIRSWYFSPNVRAMSQATPEDRLFGYLKEADHLNVALLCYQIWDFAVSLAIPEHREIIFLVHHVMAGITAWYSLEFQMMPFYCIFYGGCSELSTVFLVWADADQFFPSTQGSAYATFILFCQGIFALLFFSYRVCGWIRYSVPLWKDTLQVLQTGSAEKHRPGKSSFLYLFLTLDILLGAMQLFWFAEIIKQATAMGGFVARI